MNPTMTGVDVSVGIFWREKTPFDWERGLFMELKRILVVESGAIPEQVWDQISSTEETKKIWITSLTHYSVDFQDNYEYFETMGDALLDSALKYLIFTNASVWQSLQKTTGVEGRISNIAQTYTSKTWMRSAFQSKFGDLYKYIRCTEMFKNQRDLMEDCMESMVFAIQHSLDRVSWKGQYKGPGFPAVNKFVEWLYQKETKNFPTTQKVPTQFLKEILEFPGLRYTDVTNELLIRYPSAHRRLPVDGTVFWKAYGPKDLGGFDVKNPFERYPSFADRLPPFIKFFYDKPVMVFYFTQEDYNVYKQEYRPIDKKTASAEFVKALLHFLELAYPKQVADKKKADIGGIITEDKQRKEFQQYGFNESDYSHIMGVLPSNIIRETVQMHEGTNFFGRIYIMWGVNQNTNMKEKLFSVEIPSDKVENRHALIADAASAAFGGYSFSSMDSEDFV